MLKSFQSAMLALIAFTSAPLLAHDLYLVTGVPGAEDLRDKSALVDDSNRSSAADKTKQVRGDKLWDLRKIESSLKVAALNVRRDVTVTQPFLSVPGRVFVIGNGEAEIQAYIYHSPEQRAQDTDKLDRKTATPPTIRAAWMMPPSLVTNGNLAAIILTRDESLRQKIANVLNKH
jgi:hypothetical protein